MPPIGREVSPGHRVVSAAMLPDVLTECPHCGSKAFTVHGSYQRSFQQVYEDSKLKPDSMSLGGQAVQEIEGIACPGCNIHTIIEDENVFERESIIFDLQTQIAALQGRNVVVPGKEWKN